MSARLLSLASLATLLATLPAAPAALAQSGGGLAACRALADAAQRLACYDALPLPSLSAAPASPAVATAPIPAASSPAGQFGFEQRALASAPESIDTRIDGQFGGWGPKDRLRLANGQVWQVVDGSSASLNLQSPKVRVRRGVFGAFYLDIEGTGRTPRVKRLE
jgi:hypothetical protein